MSLIGKISNAARAVWTKLRGATDAAVEILEDPPRTPDAAALPSSILERARSAMGHGVIYKLGCGGRDPKAPHPWDAEKRCECSAFVAWCLGRAKKDPEFGWIETTRIVRDARGARTLFALVEDHTEARLGDLLVYGDYSVSQNGVMQKRQGHCGVISRVPTQQGLVWWEDVRVIHCSSGNSKRLGDAIAETNGRAFRARGLVVRCKVLP